MMKLGSQTGSVTNHIQSRAVKGEPEAKVGMGATVLAWSDRYAATITEVTELVNKRYAWEIKVVRDKTKLVSGSTMSESQEYEYSPGSGSSYTFRKLTEAHGGFWVEGYINPDTGKFKKTQGRGLRIGERDEYRDPTF